MAMLKMTRACLLLMLCIGLAGCKGDASPSKQVYQVGVLIGVDFFADTFDGFKSEMAALGYVEGQNIEYELHRTNVDADAERKILEGFISNRKDLIVTSPTEVSIMAKEMTRASGIPVIFANAFTEETQLIESIRKPGGNITGVRFPGPELAIKRFELLAEILPDMKRVWVPFLAGYPSVNGQLELLRKSTEAYGVELVEAPVTGNACACERDCSER